MQRMVEVKRVLGVVHGQGWALHSQLPTEDGETPSGEVVMSPVIAWLVVERKVDKAGIDVDGPLYYRQLVPLTVDSSGYTTEGVGKGEWLVPPGDAEWTRPATGQSSRA